MPLPARATSDGPPDAAYTKRYDYDGSSNLIYEGWAKASLGAATSAASWAIKKYTYTGSNLTLVQWSPLDSFGIPKEASIWDNRASSVVYA